MTGGHDNFITPAKSGAGDAVPARTEYCRVHRDDPVSIAHLRRIYETSYPELFPDPALRENWEQWEYYLDHAAEENFFILAGENISDPERAIIHGFIIGAYFEASQTGLLCYVGVHKTARKDGVASALVARLTAAMDAHAQSLGCRLKGLFAEANDPAQIAPDEDCIPPATRLKIYARWQALQVPVSYVCPSLHSPWRKEGRLVLLSLPVFGGYAGPDDIVAMLGDYYRAAELTPETDRDFIHLREEIEDWRGYLSLAHYDPQPAHHPA